MSYVRLWREGRNYVDHLRVQRFRIVGDHRRAEIMRVGSPAVSREFARPSLRSATAITLRR